MRSHHLLAFEAKRGKRFLSIRLSRRRKSIWKRPTHTLKGDNITESKKRSMNFCTHNGDGETNVCFHVKQSGITAATYLRGSWVFGTYTVMCNMSHFYTKHLFSINCLHRSWIALPPHFHFPSSRPPLGRCTPVPFVLSTSVAMETLLLFSPLPSYQEQPWILCQDLLCTDSIFFQCLDKSVEKPCLHFFPQHHSFVLGPSIPMDLPMFWRWFSSAFFFT